MSFEEWIAVVGMSTVATMAVALFALLLFALWGASIVLCKVAVTVAAAAMFVFGVCLFLDKAHG